MAAFCSSRRPAALTIFIELLFVESFFPCVAILRRPRGLGESGVRTVPAGLFDGLTKLENL